MLETPEPPSIVPGGSFPAGKCRQTEHCLVRLFYLSLPFPGLLSRGK